MKCECCKKQKNSLHPKNSNLIRGMDLLLCQECIDAKHEPRFIIILCGRQNGYSVVAAQIKDHRYHGADILATELIE